LRLHEDLKTFRDILKNEKYPKGVPNM